MRLTLRALAVLALFVGMLLEFPFWYPSPPTSAPLGPLGQSRASLNYLSGWADDRLRRRPGETDLTFASRVMRTVHLATYHCEADEVRQGLAAQIASPLAPDVVRFGYLDPSVMRCGYCHQRAFVLAEALRRGGIESAQAYALSEHVVTLFIVSGQYYFADADYGIGPVRYEGDSYSSIPDQLYADRVDPDTLVIVRRAFARTTDDGPYMSHEWLMSLATRQADEVRRIERRLGFAAMGAIGLAFLLLMLAHLLPRASLAQRLRHDSGPSDQPVGNRHGA